MVGAEHMGHILPCREHVCHAKRALAAEMEMQRSRVQGNIVEAGVPFCE